MYILYIHIHMCVRGISFDLVKPFLENFPIVTMDQTCIDRYRKKYTEAMLQS